MSKTIVVLLIIVSTLIVLIFIKSIKNINKTTCPNCSDENFEPAVYQGNQSGICYSCGYTEDIQKLNERQKKELKNAK